MVLSGLGVVLDEVKKGGLVEEHLQVVDRAMFELLHRLKKLERRVEEGGMVDRDKGAEVTAMNELMRRLKRLEERLEGHLCSQDAAIKEMAEEVKRRWGGHLKELERKMDLRAEKARAEEEDAAIKAKAEELWGAGA